MRRATHEPRRQRLPMDAGSIRTSDGRRSRRAAARRSRQTRNSWPPAPGAGRADRWILNSVRGPGRISQAGEFEWVGFRIDRGRGPETTWCSRPGKIVGPRLPALRPGSGEHRGRFGVPMLLNYRRPDLNRLERSGTNPGGGQPGCGRQRVLPAAPPVGSWFVAPRLDSSGSRNRGSSSVEI